MYERVKQLNEAELASIFNEKRAAKVVLPSSSGLIVPPAFLIVEKSLNGGASYGSGSRSCSVVIVRLGRRRWSMSKRPSRTTRTCRR